MWVVKLGGSLAYAPELRYWLAELAERGAGRVVVVPGGGPFADAVRRAQDRWSFPDLTAHHMALLAMEQYGAMLVGIEPWLVPAATRREIEELRHAGRVPVWMPGAMLAERNDPAPTWAVTSDSLAAWLTLEISAENLLLVKCVSPRSGRVSVHDLASQGIVDAALSGFLAGARFRTWWMGSADHAQLGRILAEERGTRVTLTKPRAGRLASTPV